MLNSVDFLLDFVFPQHCLHCETFVEQSEMLCEKCLDQLEFVGEISQEKLFTNSGLSQIFCAFRFDPVLQSVIHKWKYEGWTKLTPFLAGVMTKAVKSSEFDLIAPVPLHRVKKRDRGFNQSELLAKFIAEQTSISHVPNAIRRRRYTKTQTKLSARERMKNVSEAFVVVKPEILQNKTVLLIDDVLTTGSTIGECANVALSAGANRVLGVTIAIAK